MATHSSVLAWRIPGTGEPGGLPSMGSHRVRHDWNILVVVVVYVYMDFPGGSDDKASVYNVRDLGSIPGLGRFPGEGNGNPLQCPAWRIPGTEEPGGLLSVGSHRVGHD